MSNLLVLYEIADKAAKVTSKKSLANFEKWIYQILRQYHDAAVERVAHVHLFRLKAHFQGLN